MVNLNLLQRCEFVHRQPFDGRGEGAIALVMTGLWFTGILLRQGSGEVGQWTVPESLWEASSFVVFGAIPIFGLATPLGENIAQRLLRPRNGLGFQLLLCLCLGSFVTMAKLGHFNPAHFDGIQQLHSLIFPDRFWLNTLCWLVGLFVAVRIPFVMLAQRQLFQQPWQLLMKSRSLWFCLGINALYLIAVHTNALGLHPQKGGEGYWMSLLYILICCAMTWPGWKRRHLSTSPFDFFLIVLSLGVLYWLSVPSFRFGVCVAVDVYILTVIYGSGLGRSHFGYSFQLRPWDGRLFLKTILLAALVLIPLAVLTGFVQPDPSKVFNGWHWVSYFLLFSFRVGIFEEMFFRAGLMVLIRDALPGKASPATLILWSAGIASVIFGLVHVGNEPGATSSLSPWTYKGLYILLATLASLCYSFAFAETNRLNAPIWVHGFVDTMAVVLLGGFLAVPF
jgi:membrane protease YdiL (CAAX protease family)